MSKPRPVPDQPARDLIRARLDINLLVEAGAGSGKTECLAQRMAAGVLEGRYKVELYVYLGTIVLLHSDEPFPAGTSGDPRKPCSSASHRWSWSSSGLAYGSPA